MDDINDIIKLIIKSSYKIYNNLGAGFLEKVYEKALLIELKELGLIVERQFPIAIYYKDENIGNYFADIFVEERLIIELKTSENLSLAHERQLVNYLVATNIDDGLLINFGLSKVQIKRKFRVYKK